MVAGTVVLSIATTLITLAVERMRGTRCTPAAEPESRTSAAKPEDAQAEVDYSTWNTVAATEPGSGGRPADQVAPPVEPSGRSEPSTAAIRPRIRDPGQAAE
jgi:hypothetical protein